MKNNRYVLITPARNEEKYIGKTLEAITRQIHKPLKWVIVNDNSTDGTEEIIRKFCNNVDFIELLNVINFEERNFGAQVRAINKGYELLKHLDYDFIGNLDADVSFEPDYYIKVIDLFIKFPKLGIAGGSIWEKTKAGVFMPRPNNSTRSVAHAIQLFRKDCFEQINGYTPCKYGGSDWIVQIKASMLGWDIFADRNLRVFHHKPGNSAEGRIKGAIRQGMMDYSIGSHILFEFFKVMKRLLRGGCLYAVARFYGFLKLYLRGERKEVDKDIEKFLKREQLGRLGGEIKLL